MPQMVLAIRITIGCVLVWTHAQRKTISKSRYPKKYCKISCSQFETIQKNEIYSRLFGLFLP